MYNMDPFEEARQDQGNFEQPAWEEAFKKKVVLLYFQNLPDVTFPLKKREKRERNVCLTGAKKESHKVGVWRRRTLLFLRVRKALKIYFFPFVRVRKVSFYDVRERGNFLSVHFRLLQVEASKGISSSL